jgi:tetratricopeptide (TPR) repeat protein
MRSADDSGTGTAQVPLIGRDEDIARLKEAADEVRTRQATRIVTIVGPNGAGKTRLVREVLEEINEGPGRRFRAYRGHTKGAATGYALLSSLLRSRFGIVDGGNPDDVREQVGSQVSKVLDDRKVGDVCFFLGQILDIPFPPSPLTKAVVDDAAQGEALRRAVLRTFFDADAARGPICLVFDDLDMAGDDSLRLVAHLVEHATGPMLIVCAARAELMARWPGWFDLGGARHRRVELGPVHDVIAERIMTELLAPCEGGPPRELVEAGVRLGGGNIGLLETMVHLFRDAGVLSDVTAGPGGRRWRVHLDALARMQLPFTPEETIEARIAALDRDERRLLENAAIMGHTFWRGGLLVLARVDRKPPVFWSDMEAELTLISAVMGALEERDYVIRRDTSAIEGEVEYAFRHGAERDKLKGLLDRGYATRAHRAIADWLSNHRNVGSRREYTAVLARHLAEAGESVRAAGYYLDAGDAAREAYAAQEAAELYERGLDLLGDSDARRRLDALHNRGDVLVVLGRTDDAFNAFGEMLAIAYRLDLRGKGGAAHNRIGRLHRAIGNLSEATQHLETALALFDSVGDTRGVAACHDDVGKVLWTRGDYESALERMRVALDERKKLGERRSIALSLHNIGAVWRDHGRPNQAREALDAALTIRREIGDLPGLAQTLNGLGRLAQDQRQLEDARSLYREAYDVAMEVGERNRMAIVLTNLGEIHYRLGDSTEAIRILTLAEELCDELGDKLHLAEAKRGLAKAHLMQGDLKRARSAVKQAVDLFGTIRSKSHLAVALRTLGEITAAGAWGPAHEGKAVDYFMRSIALCKEIGNELEIAKSYHCFSQYVVSSRHYRDNVEIQREANKLGAMANEIFGRLKLSPEQVEHG